MKIKTTEQRISKGNHLQFSRAGNFNQRLSRIPSPWPTTVDRATKGDAAFYTADSSQITFGTTWRNFSSLLNHA